MMMPTMRWGALRAAGVLIAVLLGASDARAQGNCEVNNQTTCTVGGDATHAITITVHAAVRLSTPSTALTIPTPTGGNVTNPFFGTELLVPFLVRANRSYALAVSSSQATWTASGVGARANKPRADLQFSATSGSGFADMTGTPAQFFAGSAESDAAQRPLYLRVRYTWGLDTPGGYSLPITIVITAP
jgi:hypothetical protein